VVASILKVHTFGDCSHLCLCCCYHWLLQSEILNVGTA
jgi:hypothetical protein